MKIGFNEATDRYCEGHSVMKDLELCEKNGFDIIDIQSECLNRDLEKGACTLEELGEWFKTHHLKMASYNALCFFNMKQTQQEKDAVIEEFKEIVRRCGILGCNMVVVVPSVNIPVDATVEEIREDSVAVIKDLLKIAEPKGIKLSLEFCGSPSMCINQFKDAYDIVQQVNSPNVGLTLDQFHFHAMSSHWEDFEKADGKKIFIWHLDGSEHMPCGAPYYTDEKRLWPGDKNDCIDHKRYADTLKKIGFSGDCCILELFRPEYYKLSVEENIKKSAQVTKAHVQKYWG